MRVLHQVQNYPLRFLLYLEWSLLLIVLVVELFRFQVFFGASFSIINILSLATFGFMGLYIPRRSKCYGVIYTALEFFLIFVMTIGGGGRIYPLLYIVLVLRNSFIFNLVGRLVVMAIALVAFSAGLVYRFQWMPLPLLSSIEDMRYIFVSLILLFGLVMLFLQLLVNAVLAERQNRQQLAIANEQLRRYATRIEDIVTLQERNRIAREIHDSLGHSLTAFNLYLEAAIRLLPTAPDEVMDLLVEAKQVSAKTMQDVRESVSTLRADQLKDKPLDEAIAPLIEEFRRSSQITLHTHIRLSRAVPVDIKTAVYRVLQEALTNIAKYSEATLVNIHIDDGHSNHINTLTETKRLPLSVTKGEALFFCIEDNGKGFNIEQNRTGFGIQGMRERVLMLQGEFKVVSAPAQGCKIAAILPLPIC